MTTDTRSRLKRLQSSGELGSKNPPAAVNTVQARQEFLFPGQDVFAETNAASCYYRQLRVPLDQKHGNGPLAELLHCRGADLVLPARDGLLAEINPRESLFLDIETTGLVGGTGTWVVLLGLGWVQNNAFYLRQYFLRHPSEEKAMLAHFTETAARFTSVVTFNGKTFDLPMIQSRQILTGLCGIRPKHHLDLLFCSRRLWRERLASCSLRSLESALLGLQRHGDIPGEEIPAVYFNYLRRGETTRLRDIFEHNVLDILSMVRLLACVAGAAKEEPEHPADCISLGRLCYEQGQVDRAVRLYHRAAACGEERLEQAAVLRLSFIFKRQGFWSEAAELWNQLIQQSCRDVTPYVELAKYYEHRAGDYKTAQAMTEQALARSHGGLYQLTSGQLSRPALHHRLNRLQQKLARHS
ncbi:MAG: ribonuclease H-like domain-containing protein [Bacillota bacterium]|nr:ribonuclease H-like domain-containing protein [Bacillota bacterium]MDW7683825.1 ribonuclease H-like domain-containing protein [Bacillota bacterium]